MSREMKDSGIAWIGEIPKVWNCASLLQVLRARISDGPHETPKLVESGIPFISVDSLNDTENIDFEVVKKYISLEDYKQFSKKTFLEKGDILFTKSATIGKTAIVKNDIFMIWSPIAVLKPNDLIYNKYLYHFVSNGYFKDYICQLSTFNTQFNIGMRTLEKAKICFPPLPEQQKIAEFLDRKCGEIDELVALQEKMIEELKAYKQSVITEAVTKGLNPNAPMKDSGIEWIGEIPEHWEVSRIGNHFKLRDEKNYKPINEVQLLSLYTDIGVFPHGEQKEKGNKAVSTEGYKVVYKNDIVVNIILAWMGAIGVSNYNGVTSPAYDVYCPEMNTVIPHFFHYVFRTRGIANECYKYGRGIMMMRWRTYHSEFKQINIPLPPLPEQQAIADYLDTKCAEIDELVALKQQKIDSLKEYKKSLIYEYVTGKKEVI